LDVINVDQLDDLTVHLDLVPDQHLGHRGRLRELAPARGNIAVPVALVGSAHSAAIVVFVMPTKVADIKSGRPGARFPRTWSP
jgi:hypothetical protein